MAPVLVFSFGEKQVTAAGSGIDAVRSRKSVDSVATEAEQLLGVPPGTYDFYDRYGILRTPEDFQRAVEGAGDGECIIEVRELPQYRRLREMEARITQLEASAKEPELMKASVEKMDRLVAEMKGKLHDEVVPTLQELLKEKNNMQKDLRHLSDKIGTLSLQEMREIADQSRSLREEARSSMKRVGQLEAVWTTDKAALEAAVAKCQKDVEELTRNLRGKIEVFVMADADLRRDLTVTSERLQVLADDLKVAQEEHQLLAARCQGALEENQGLRTALGEVREDNEHVRMDVAQVRTRVHCLEGIATEKFDGFAPGVLYFRQWHRSAKGSDVQLSPDLSTATGRGFLAATGVVLGTDEGLAVADGPCRRFGTPGSFSSYFELEVDEVCVAPAGVGGVYVGITIQSGEEIGSHPRKEFDGWLIGGHGKALICRASANEIEEGDSKLPATFAPGASPGAIEAAEEALRLLRQALPPRPKGEVREVESVWNSEGLRMGDRIGVLFRCHRDGGARLRVTVNSAVVATHEFIDAPPAQAVGFLTPIIRLAGTGKSVKILPGIVPPSRILAD